MSIAFIIAPTSVTVSIHKKRPPIPSSCTIVRSLSKYSTFRRFDHEMGLGNGPILANNTSGYFLLKIPAARMNISCRLTRAVTAATLPTRTVSAATPQKHRNACPRCLASTVSKRSGSTPSYTTRVFAACPCSTKISPAKRLMGTIKRDNEPIRSASSRSFSGKCIKPLRPMRSRICQTCGIPNCAATFAPSIIAALLV